MTNAVIQNIIINCYEYRLINPYVLSFGTINSLHSIQVQLATEEGKKRLAEVVPLPGYSEETKESVLEYLNSILSELKGKPTDVARKMVAASIRKNPFACSPLLTAIDLLDFEEENTDTSIIPFVIPCASSHLSELRAIIQKINRQNVSSTIKVKLSGDLEKDIACIDTLEREDTSQIFLRLDANQAFSEDHAQEFYTRASSALFSSRIEYIEQPLDPDNWKGHEKLARTFPIKTMLDESIITKEDIDKAAEGAIPFIKFKLFKQGGVKELIEQIEYSYQKGISIVLGNGVATRISNNIENMIYLAYRHKISGASEANGFLKIAY